MNDYRTPLASNHLIKNGSTEYTVLRVLGAGGTGYVYLCKQSNGAYVAIKELYPKELWHVLERQATGDLLFTGSTDSQETLDWYRQTVKSAALLEQEHTKSSSGDNNSPYFMQCLQTPFEDHGTLYTVYNTFEGNSFGDYIKEKRKSLTNADFLSTILSIIIITCKKLSYLHQQDLLHMDISPWNIFVTNHGGLEDIPYLLDFGSAFKLGSDASPCRFSVTDGFTPAEIYRHATGIGKLPISAAIDTYSLVAVLFYALTGKTFDDALWEMNNDWSKLLEDYPDCEDLCEIFRTGLNSQHQRYQSADGLMDALCEYRAQIRGNNKNDDLDLKLSELNKSFETFQQKMFQQHQEFKNEINQKLDDLGVTETARFEKLFKTIDCILSAKIRDHKTIGNLKGVLFTRYAFLSLCAYDGDGKAVMPYIDTLPDFTVEGIAAETLNALFQQRAKSDRFFEIVCRRYCFQNPQTPDEKRSRDMIFLQKIAPEERELSATDYFDAWEYLLSAYRHCNHNDYFSQLKFEMNTTVSQYAQAMVCMGLIADSQTKQHYFDACKYLIKTHNHNSSYMFSLLDGNNVHGHTEYYFASPEDVEPIQELVALYFDDMFFTDMSSVHIGDKYMKWLAETKQFSYEYLCELIKTKHCFDEKIWETVLKKDYLAASVREYLLNNVLVQSHLAFQDDLTKRKAVAFVLMLGARNMFSLIQASCSGEENETYNRAFQIFWSAFCKYHSSPYAKRDPLFIKKANYINNTIKRIEKSLAFSEKGKVKAMCETQPSCTPADTNQKAEQALFDAGFLVENGDRIDVGKYVPLTTINPDAETFFRSFRMLYSNFNQGPRNREIFECCYTNLLQSANYYGLTNLSKEYCEYLSYSKSYLSKETRLLAKSTISEFIKASDSIVSELFSNKCLQNIVFLLSNCQDEWVYEKLFLALLRTSSQQKKKGFKTADDRCDFLFQLYDRNIITPEGLCVRLKAERLTANNTPYSNCFSQLLGMNMCAWRAAQTFPFVEYLSRSENFCELNPKTQAKLVEFLAKYAPLLLVQLPIDFSEDLDLAAVAIIQLREIPEHFKVICSKMVDLVAQNPSSLKRHLRIPIIASLISLYRDNPQKTDVLAARGASILFGTLMKGILELKSSQDIGRRLESFPIIMGHPCIRNLASYYARELYRLLPNDTENLLAHIQYGPSTMDWISKMCQNIFPDWYGKQLSVESSQLLKTVVCPQDVAISGKLDAAKQHDAHNEIEKWRTGATEVFEPASPAIVYTAKNTGVLSCLDGKHIFDACKQIRRSPQKIAVYVWEPEPFACVENCVSSVTPKKLWSKYDFEQMYIQLQNLDATLVEKGDSWLLKSIQKGYPEMTRSRVYRNFDSYQMVLKYFGDQMYMLLSRYSSQ